MELFFPYWMIDRAKAFPLLTVVFFLCPSRNVG